MKISVKTKPNLKGTLKFLCPEECFGAESGRIFQLYAGKLPQRRYMIGAGINDRPISIWWRTNGKKWRISSESKKDLKQFSPHITFVDVTGQVKIKFKAG